METTSQEYDMDDVMVSRFDFVPIYSHLNLNLNHVYVSALLSGVAQINLINYLCYGRETCKASLNVPHCKICILTHQLHQLCSKMQAFGLKPKSTRNNSSSPTIFILSCLCLLIYMICCDFTGNLSCLYIITQSNNCSLFSIHRNF